MQPWLKKLGVFVLILWNLILTIYVVKINTRLYDVEENVRLVVKNQEHMVAHMKKIVNNQETLLYLHSEHLELYGMVRAYFRRFHEEAQQIENTRREVEGCAHED